MGARSCEPENASGRAGEIALTASPGYLSMGETPEARQNAYHLYVYTNRPYDMAMSHKLAEVTVGA